MKKLILLITLLAGGYTINAQNANRTCGTPELPQEYENWMQAKILETQALQQAGRAQLHYDIPVVVHVIHNGEMLGNGTNISDAQILSQIAVLNEDYRKLNADTNLVPVPFRPMRADIDVNFHLVTVDPSGNPTTGIERFNRNTMSWSTPPFSMSYINANIKPTTIWNPTNYFNIWVCNITNGILGYATFPPNSTLSGLSGVGTSTTDGVVILYNAMGRVGNVSAPYHKGRTATHEVGHYLGLRHIWGDGSCPSTNNDYCTDTPPQDGENYGCPTYPLIVANNAQYWFGPSCTGTSPGSMFMNYMDYVNDACMQMFSNDQKTRMQTALLNSPMRNHLHAGVATTTARLEGIKLYPNPTKGELTIVVPTTNQNSEVEILVTNILGKTVYQTSVTANSENEIKLNLTSLNSGLYIVQLKNEKGIFTQRVDINK